MNSSFPSAAPLRLWASQRGPELQRCMARDRYQGHLWADLRSIAFSRHSALAPSEQTLSLSFLFHGHRRDSSVHQTKRFPRDSPGFGFLLSASSDRGVNFQHDGVRACEHPSEIRVQRSDPILLGTPLQVMQFLSISSPQSITHPSRPSSREIW